MKAERNVLYSLIPLEDFKGLLGVDDRDDKIARFCLVTSTHTIEQYCKRRLLKKTHFERSEFYGDLVLPLREYPVGKILAGYLIGSGKWGAINNEQLTMNNEKGDRRNNQRFIYNGEFLEPEFYCVQHDELYLSPALRRYPGLKAIKVIYWAGYALGNVPPDLATACLELAAWNFNRYKGKRIGMTGNIRGAGKEGEHFEQSMPENVKNLLEPYKRKVI